MPGADCHTCALPLANAVPNTYRQSKSNSNSHSLTYTYRDADCFAYDNAHAYGNSNFDTHALRQRHSSKRRI